LADIDIMSDTGSTGGYRYFKRYRINWSDLDVMSDAGINWSDIDILSDAGVNWADMIS